MFFQKRAYYQRGGIETMVIANFIAFVILLIGGLNWGLVGIFRWNLVEAIFGGFGVVPAIIYILVMLSAIWLLISAIIRHSIYLRSDEA